MDLQGPPRGSAGASQPNSLQTLLLSSKFPSPSPTALHWGDGGGGGVQEKEKQEEEQERDQMSLKK